MTVNAQIIISMRNGASPGIKQITADTKLLNQSLSTLRSGFAALGVSIGAAALVKLGKDAFDAANSLEKTEATVRALSGSVSRYDQVLRTAQTGQSLYGGSLEANLRGLGTLVNLSNRASVSLGDLDNISRRLAVVDPVQGIEGANIALKEFLSDDGAAAALSLARRFELPRHALAELAKEGISAKDRLAGLNELLNQNGITTQVLTDRTKTTAAVYDQLGAAALNARDRVGALIAEMLKTPAQGLTNLLNTGSVAPGATDGRDQAEANAVQAATSFEDYAARVRAANAQVEAVLAKDPIAALFLRQQVTLEQLNPVQFAYTQSLTATGTAYADAVTKARALGDVSDSLVQQTQGQSAAFQALIPQMAQVSSYSAEDAGQVLALNSAFLQGQVSAEQVKIILEALIKAHQKAAEQADLQALETRRLTSDLYGVVRAADLAAAAIAGVNGAQPRAHLSDNSPTGGAVGSLGGLLTDKGNLDAATQAADRVHQSEVQLALSRAKTSAERIAILQREANATTDIATRNGLLSQIEGERNSSAKAHTSELDKQLKLQESTYDSITKQRDALLAIDELTIRDRQQDRDDIAKKRTALAILNSANASADFKDRARDALALIDVQDRQRAQQLEEKQATADGSIVNGKVIQSRPGDGTLSPIPTSPGAAAAPAAAGAPPAAATSTARTIILRLVDGANRVLAELTEPFILDDLMHAMDHADVGIG